MRHGLRANSYRFATVASRRQPLAFLQLASRASCDLRRAAVFGWITRLAAALSSFLMAALISASSLSGFDLSASKTVLMWILIAFLTARFRSRRLADCRPR